MQKKSSGGAPRVKSSHAPAVLYIAIGGAQQSAALTRQTAAVMVPLFALQIDQICDVPFLRITFPVFFLKCCLGSSIYTWILIALTLCSTVLSNKLKSSLTLSLLKPAALDFLQHVAASDLVVGVIS